jgi:RNA polymerase sigma-70 factor (ECF subfamily)
MNNSINAQLTNMAEGDINALGELYGILSVRIFNYARTITRNKEMAEDITHDVFLQIYNHASRLAKMANPVAYIMTAARNQAFDHIKRSSRITATLEDISEIGSSCAPFDRLFIEDAFSRLPANQRETVYLHHVCGFTYKEVSKIMGAPLVTVKWRCGKAMLQLQAYFINEKEENSDDITRSNNSRIAKKYAD